VKFVTKQEKLLRKLNSLLIVAFGDEALRWSTEFEWYRHFQGGRELCEDTRSFRPPIHMVNWRKNYTL